ncbi:MAG: hypothetical protein WC907_06315, partial [Acholeplasmataceae bacterium]
MLSFLMVFTNVAITWFNITVDIPLGESLNNYKENPYATLMIDNKIINDPLMYYEYEVNHTTFSVINTNYVGKYHVDYRVHFPTYGFSSDQKITFNVYDDIKPTIIADDSLTFEVNTKLPNFKDLIDYYDNYDETNDLTLKIDSSKVNEKVIGTYNVFYEVTDLSNNKETFIQSINIVDTTPPVVTLKSEIVIKVGETIDLDKFFKFEDNYDKVLTKIFLDDEINYYKSGDYLALLRVIDQSNNETSIKVNVKVTDTEAPIIKLKTNTITINYKDELSLEYLTSLIQSVTDNVDDLSYQDVDIYNYVDTNFLGDYEVIYEARDSSNLIGRTVLTVKVLDLIPPEVILLEDIEVLVFDLEPYILDYLLIKDNYSKLDKLNISITGKVDMNKIGEYRLTVSVKDEAKNDTTIPLIVKVIDNIAPTISLNDQIIITNFMKPNYLNFLTITDNYDKDLNVEIIDDNINYNQLGNYFIDVIVTDSSNNQSFLEIEVNIIDLTIPEIILKTNLVSVEYGNERLDLYSFINGVYDEYDEDLTIYDCLISENINYNLTGNYEVYYYLEDNSGNYTSELLYVKVSDNQVPIIEAINAKINQNGYFNYFDYVNAYDDYDGDISHLVKINPSFIPTTNPGIYEITYYVYDSSGNYSETKALLTIKDSQELKNYFLYFGGFIILGIGGFIFYKYKK